MPIDVSLDLLRVAPSLTLALVVFFPQMDEEDDSVDHVIIAIAIIAVLIFTLSILAAIIHLLKLSL